MFLNQKFKIFEFIFLFILIPILFFMKIIPIYLLHVVLLLISLYSLIILKKFYKAEFFDKFKLDDLKYILWRFSLVASFVILFTYVFFEEYFLIFMGEKIKYFLLVMIFYPLLSVIPQEFIFRKFFFKRYSSTFSVNYLLSINVFCFSWAHIFFNNYLVLLVTLLGGYLFAQTYTKTNSFSLVCLEHILYGNLLFTIGLGDYLYHYGTISFLNIM